MEGAMLEGLIVAAILILWLGRLAARQNREGPEHAPAWTGPDSGLLEKALREELSAEERTLEFAREPELDELARHHAFAMASRNFIGTTDPEGLDHSERRRRLHPGLVGRSAEFVGSFVPQGGQSADDFARSFLADHEASISEFTDDQGWLALGVGVAVEQGRGAVCLVFGDLWADLSGRTSWGPDSGWECQGKTRDGTERLQLAVRLIQGSVEGPEEPANFEVDWNQERFRLQIGTTDPSDDTWVEILRDGRPGLRRRLC